MLSRAISILALAVSALPASATTTYCNSGCTNSNSGMTHAAFESVASAFSFPANPITFVSGGLNGAGVYVDTSGTAFAGLINANPDPLALNGTALKQTGDTVGGTRSIAITLPANTYAFAMFVSAANVTGALPVVDFAPISAGSELTLSTFSGATPFFGIISSTPLTTLYLGNYLGGGAFQINSFVYGTEAPAAETPETSAFVLTGTGLLGVWSIRRRRSSPASPAS
jgi:hypothetical protein